jgi:ADP-ribose pyrophosphatase YjhB (NUDIX family)
MEKKYMQPTLAPREEFEQILKWAVIPTFDLVFAYGDQGLVMARRKIEPYKNVWAFPGLRMLKGEGIDDTLQRIAQQELGITIDPAKRIFLGQYVGKFATEHNRQDLSTGYFIQLTGDEELLLNPEHFSAIKLCREAPQPIGAMYKYYFERTSELR